MRILPQKFSSELRRREDKRALKALICTLIFVFCVRKKSRNAHRSRNLVSRRLEAAWCEPIVLHVEYGLNNRLRSYASVAAFARRSNCSFFVIWPIDNSCKATFTELFRRPAMVSAIYDTKEEFMREWSSEQHWKSYDYTQTPQIRSRLLIRRPNAPYSGIYVRSSEVVHFQNFQITSSNLGTELAALEPVDSVTSRIATFKQRYNLQDSIGLHIRMNYNFRTDIPGISVDLLQRLALTNLAEERRRCHYSSFVKVIKNWPHYTKGGLVVVASDSSSALIELRKAFSESTVVSVDEYLSNACNAGNHVREDICLRYCFLEQKVLAETRHFFYSTSSSLSENILYLRSNLTRTDQERSSGCE